MYGKKWIASALVIASLTMTTACAKKYETHGTVVKQSQIDRIKIGLHTRNDIAMILGSPSSMSTFNPNRWYYFTEKAEVKALGQRSVLERDIVIVDFNEKGVLTSLSFKNKQDAKNVNPTKKTTKTHGQTMGIIDQFIDNVGKGL